MAPLKSRHSSTTAKFSKHWSILILLLPSRAATPEFPTTDSENDQITASNNSLEFKITKKTTEKAVYFVRFALFEVTITKKPTVKAAKTSLLWQREAFSPTSDDLKVIVCDSKAVKRSFLLQLMQSFWYSLKSNTIKQEIHVHIPCGWCVAEADWLIPGHSICEDQWNCILQIRGAVT